MKNIQVLPPIQSIADEPSLLNSLNMMTLLFIFTIDPVFQISPFVPEVYILKLHLK